MAKIYEVELTETINRTATLTIEAESEGEAVAQAEKAFHDGNVPEWINQNHVALVGRAREV